MNSSRSNQDLQDRHGKKMPLTTIGNTVDGMAAFLADQAGLDLLDPEAVFQCLRHAGFPISEAMRWSEESAAVALGIRGIKLP